MRVDDRPLTSQLLRALARSDPPMERTAFNDPATPGLRIRHEPTGKLTWNLQKRVRRGKVRQHVLGGYPDVPLAEARRLAVEISIESERGIDRFAERQVLHEKMAASLVGDALDRYETMKLREGLRTAKASISGLRLNLAEARLLEESMLGLTERDFQRILERKAETAPVMANRLYAGFKTWLRWAFEVGLIETDLHMRLRKPVRREVSRDRVLSLAETQSVWEATGALSAWRHRNYARLLILTGLRGGEINGLTKGEVNLVDGRIEIAGARMKAGRGHTAPLSNLALRILAETIDATPDRDSLFELHNMSRLKTKLDEVSGVTGWRLHDLRRTLATQLVEHGVRADVVDRILAHSQPGVGVSAVAQVYNRAALMDERKDAVEAWAAMVCPSLC